VKPILRWIPTTSVLLLAGALAAPAAASDDETLTEIVNVLREQGLIDEDEHAELAAKAAKKDAKRAWVDRVNVWGDFRARYEAFDYEQDVYTRSADAADPTTNIRLQNRHRARYRARLNVSGKVASRATVFFRLASGGSDARSANQTLGSGNDFDTDDVRFDLAYATLTPFPDGELPGVEGGYFGVDVGKVKNPFIWKALGSDALLFDNDITPEGASLRIKGEVGPLALFANGGVYVVDENSSTKDPKLLGGQVGGALDVADHVTLGARGSLYHFFSLDSAFYTRAAGGGNLVDGLGSPEGSIQLAETSAFAEFGMWELFPVLVFGSYANNLTANSSLVFPGEDRQDDAWATGVFVGDEKRLVQLGFAYFHIEANAAPSMFLDSDILDSTSNRHGYMASARRQLFDAVTLKLTGFASKRIEGGVVHANSGPGSDRLRGQADMVFKF
jgi:hypothetical protein